MLRPFSTAAGFDFLTAGVSREDFRRASDISGDAKADITLTQITDIEYPRERGVGCAFTIPFAQTATDR